MNDTTSKKLNKRKLFFWILSILCMITIFYFSSQDSDESTQESHKIGRAIGHIVKKDFDSWTFEEQEEFAAKIDFPVRKAAHFLEYATLGTLLALAWFDELRKKRGNILVPFAVGAAYSVTDELHQLIVSGRAGQIRDVLIDSSGVFTGVLITTVIISCVKKISK
ncbi:MAG: VanZ family protein [Eubacterium sp.]|nr:VanZ family protein [Eubacterium sp.]